MKFVKFTKYDGKKEIHIEASKVIAVQDFGTDGSIIYTPSSEYWTVQGTPDEVTRRLQDVSTSDKD